MVFAIRAIVLRSVIKSHQRILFTTTASSIAGAVIYPVVQRRRPCLESRKTSNLLGFNERVELRSKLTYELFASDHDARLDVPLMRPFREVRRRDQRDIIIDDNALGMPRGALV
jgi:hypothetical protein